MDNEIVPHKFLLQFSVLVIFKFPFEEKMRTAMVMVCETISLFAGPGTPRSILLFSDEDLLERGIEDLKKLEPNKRYFGYRIIDPQSMKCLALFCRGRGILFGNIDPHYN